MTMVNQRENTAYHEAGHAAVSIHFNHAPVVASIEPGEGNLGHVRGPYNQVNRWWLRECIIELYTGAEAQKRFNPGATDDDLGADGDEAEAYEALRRMQGLGAKIKGCSYEGDDAFFARLELYRAEARRLVARLWPQIESIALALLQTPTLSGDDLRRIYHEVTP